MIKRIYYKITRSFFWFSFLIYVKHYNVLESYKEKRRDSVIYAVNHGNALFDAFPILFSTNKIPVFLTRASVFGSKLANFALDIHFMMPIYRQRDGVDTVAKNKSIIETCIKLLKEGRHPVAMFPEGNHNMKFGVRTLQKGIARMAFEALDTYPDLDLKIIPIGLNYSDHMSFRANILMLKGPPIYIKPYYDLYLENKALGIKNLIDDLSAEMQKLMLYIPTDRYDEIDALYRKYRVHGSDLKENFENDKILIQNLLDGEIPKEEPKGKKRAKQLLLFRRIITFPIGIIAWLSNLIPIFLIRKIVKKVVSDPHFMDSIRYAGSTFLFPMAYFFQALLLYFIFGTVWVAGIYFLLIPFISKFYFQYLYKAP